MYNSVQSRICEAIQNRQVLRFHYQGQIRIVEPFTLGYMKGTGNSCLSAYQIGGFSKSQRYPPWGLYKINEIRNLVVTNQLAQNWRLGYNPRDSRMTRILCAA